MPYSEQYRDFIEDKHGFFSDIHTINDAQERARIKDYQFLLSNKKLIEDEFTQLFSILEKNDENREQFWLYCYYCCLLLQAYYIGYNKSDKIEDYNALRMQLWQHCRSIQLPTAKKIPDSFIVTLGKKFSNDISDIATAAQHSSKLRSYIGLLNIYRIYWTFCRITLNSAFFLFRDSQWLTKLGSLLNKTIDIDKIIKTLEIPSGIFRALSVGFFVARFLINAGTVLKHTLLPTDAEATVSIGQLFSHQIMMRDLDFLNDIVWATVNGLSNYAPVFHISASAAGWLTAGFLVFDVCLLLWRCHRAEQEYLVKKAQYLADLAFYQAQLNQELTPEQRLFCEQQCKITIEELTVHGIKREIKIATFLFDTAAAFLLASGFAASMVLTPPLLVLAAYVVCTIGVAMYLSEGAYTNYKKQQLMLEQAQLNEEDTTSALIAYQHARNDFIYTLVKNVVMPSLLIATVAIYWPAAVILAAAFVTYELYDAYQKHKQQEPPKTLQLLPDDDVPINTNVVIV